MLPLIFPTLILMKTAEASLWQQPADTVKGQCSVSDVSESGNYTRVPLECCDNSDQTLTYAFNESDIPECQLLSIDTEDFGTFQAFNKKQCVDGKFHYGESCSSSASGECSCEENGEFTAGECYAVSGSPATKFFFMTPPCDAIDTAKEVDTSNVPPSPSGGAKGTLWSQPARSVKPECLKPDPSESGEYSEVAASCCGTDDQQEALVFDQPPQCDKIQLDFGRPDFVDLYNEKSCVDGVVLYGEKCGVTGMGECSCGLQGNLALGKCYATAGTNDTKFFFRADSCFGTSPPPTPTPDGAGFSGAVLRSPTLVSLGLTAVALLGSVSALLNKIFM